jgi:branched-chain amino acid transport system ATP-binding protein
MLELRNVDAVYDGVIQVLRGVSLEVKPAQVVALLGSNGAGKTTTLKAISSLLAVEQGRVEQGEIRYDGEAITNADPARVIRAGIVQVLEGRRVLKHLNVEQNLLVGAHLRRDKAQIADDIADIYASFPSLQAMRLRSAGYLSGGEMQMLLLGRALVARPKLLLLDEPAMGLAPLIVKDLFAFLRRLCDEKGLSILLVEQNVRAALQIADHGYVMENGRIVLHAPKAELERNEDVREFYLGLSLTQERRSFREVKHYKRRKRWLG